MPRQKPASSGSLFVVSSFVWTDNVDVEGLQSPEVYTTRSAANKAAVEMMARYSELRNRGDYNYQLREDKSKGFYCGRLELDDAQSATQVRVHVRIHMVVPDEPTSLQGGNNREDAVASLVAKPASDDEEDDEDQEDEKIREEKPDVEEDKIKEEDNNDDVDDEEAEEVKPKKPAKKPAGKKIALAITSRKTIPKGKPNCLKGLKVLFTGTFNTMDRKTSVAAAEKYGAQVITKLEDTDYIILGTRAGPKKLEIINEHELDTITEEEFFQILENGVSKEKRESMAARRAADAAEGPEESEGPPKKRSRK
ncbi:uncharacterized protein BCR38DRAFT_412299 [Pseudomassariella vexata]|uniref:BRCT domain-containing protein n=1 Tax=Pseudomassariella vexata TaxID=1141098 RepID=A0A1Y2DLA5_9PEZI|nr:uncharacterized protein BCR38DRAFT_412299 [Pseudomassariella vexata]ORY60098.1 hypothetical protein BCR38DRAFT_412299 [Pseudomassariella vexata]